jgi:hypothetical protein
LKAKAEEIDSVRFNGPRQSLIDTILTSLHPKGHSKTKKNKEDYKGQQSLRRSHVKFIGTYDDHQGKDHGSGEFDEKARDIGQVVELELQTVDKLASI